MFGITAFVTFLLTVPAANWLIGNVGTVCVPQGPCLLPVGFGLTAPSGVLMVGLALVLRDIVHRDLGPRAAIAAICLGAAISTYIAPPSLVLASTAAFLLSELADFAVYQPLQKRGFIRAVFISSLVGLVIDSAVFLWLAFGSLDYLAGQIVGKVWMVFSAVIVVKATELRRAQP
jgi:hypothetical protein